jgi:homoserine O-acetyltransferase
MKGLKTAGVDADYFLLDSEYGHSATGRDAHKWAPRLERFMESLTLEAAKSPPSSRI